VPVEIEGKTPSAAEMAQLIDIIKTSYVKSVFVQKQFPVSVMESISKSSGAKIRVLDPLEEDVVTNLRKVSKEIQRGLFHAVPDQFKER
jgi:zinc transport system substrate-binding protein